MFCSSPYPVRWSQAHCSSDPSTGTVDQPDGTGERGSTFFRNTLADGISDISATGQKIAWRAGIPPGERADRTVSNDRSLADAYLEITVEEANVALNISNFDDVDLTNLVFDVKADGVSAVDEPTVVPADESVLALYKVDSGKKPFVSASLTYHNSRIGLGEDVEG